MLCSHWVQCTTHALWNIKVTLIFIQYMVPAGEGSSLNSIKIKGTVVTKPLGNNNNYLYRKREKSVFSLLMLPYIREKKSTAVYCYIFWIYRVVLVSDSGQSDPLPLSLSKLEATWRIWTHSSQLPKCSCLVTFETIGHNTCGISLLLLEAVGLPYILSYLPTYVEVLGK